MGMDVMGKNATSERGSYFRNNVWYWRPLWDYCIHVGENIIDDHLAEHGHYNDGEGLDAEGSARLAEVLRTELANGGTAEWAKNQAEWRASLPREACNLCDCTGIRTDEVGVKSGMPERELSPEVQVLTGRTHGWCNACEGVGTTENWMAHYPFSEENVREFADFLAECGGFEIW